jgi:hypothetical protein
VTEDVPWELVKVRRNRVFLLSSSDFNDAEAQDAWKKAERRTAFIILELLFKTSKRDAHRLI